MAQTAAEMEDRPRERKPYTSSRQKVPSRTSSGRSKRGSRRNPHEEDEQVSGNSPSRIAKKVSSKPRRRHSSDGSFDGSVDGSVDVSVMTSPSARRRKKTHSSSNSLSTSPRKPRRTKSEDGSMQIMQVRAKSSDDLDLAATKAPRSSRSKSRTKGENLVTLASALASTGEEKPKRSDRKKPKESSSSGSDDQTVQTTVSEGQRTFRRGRKKPSKQSVQEPKKDRPKVSDHLSKRTSKSMSKSSSSLAEITAATVPEDSEGSLDPFGDMPAFADMQHLNIGTTQVAAEWDTSFSWQDDGNFDDRGGTGNKSVQW